MLTKNCKIKLIKPMGVFTNVGEICEVVDVAEGGVISFRFGPGKMHLGCMSYDEYLKYFEPVIIEVKKVRPWHPWAKATLKFYDINYEVSYCDVYYKHNEKRLKIKSEDWGVTAEACCHYEDEFDVKKGLELASKRLLVKILDKQVKQFAEGM